MRLAWLTDFHLNFVPHCTSKKFIEEVSLPTPDAVLHDTGRGCAADEDLEVSFCSLTRGGGTVARQLDYQRGSGRGPGKEVT